ncbi:hypothetical protein ACH4YO_38310 [Streptomyces noursei]|uniref:hypothetical protein n=1 Tax=Streptomyces noursei TaxID=1971 RepID=UPI0033FEA43B
MISFIGPDGRAAAARCHSLAPASAVIAALVAGFALLTAPERGAAKEPAPAPAQQAELTPNEA